MQTLPPSVMTHLCGYAHHTSGAHHALHRIYLLWPRNYQLHYSGVLIIGHHRMTSHLICIPLTTNHKKLPIWNYTIPKTALSARPWQGYRTEYLPRDSSTCLDNHLYTYCRCFMFFRDAIPKNDWNISSYLHNQRVCLRFRNRCLHNLTLSLIIPYSAWLSRAWRLICKGIVNSKLDVPIGCTENGVPNSIVSSYLIQTWKHCCESITYLILRRSSSQ